MCTVTWQLTQTGYSVYFNRDERKGRCLALPAQEKNQQGVKAIMPIDPVGGGSWISVNELGLSLCLLNYYQGTSSCANPISRGQLLAELSSCVSLAELATRLNQLDLQQYAPFTLLGFSPDLKFGQGQVCGFCWDGVKLNRQVMDAFLTSSAVDFPLVKQHRQNLFNQMLSEYATSKDFMAFHASHLPEKSRFSVCMHRGEAHTVSFTRIDVDKSDVVMHYLAGAPCERGSPVRLSLVRTEQVGA